VNATPLGCGQVRPICPDTNQVVATLDSTNEVSNCGGPSFPSFDSSFGVIQPSWTANTVYNMNDNQEVCLGDDGGANSLGSAQFRISGLHAIKCVSGAQNLSLNLQLGLNFSLTVPGSGTAINYYKLMNWMGGKTNKSFGLAVSDLILDIWVSNSSPLRVSVRLSTGQTEAYGGGFSKIPACSHYEVTECFDSGGSMIQQWLDIPWDGSPIQLNELLLSYGQNHNQAGKRYMGTVRFRRD
jgi:hypothetical protein